MQFLTLNVIMKPMHIEYNTIFFKQYHLNIPNKGGGGGNLCQFFPIPPGIPKIGIGKNRKKLKKDQKESA